MRQVKMKPAFRRTLFLLALVLLVGLTVTGYNLINGQYEPVDVNDKTIKDIVIPEKSSARQIAKILLENDLIHSERAFLTYCKRYGYDSSLKAGHYQFSRSQSLKEIVEAIAQGRIVTITFTIPEGYTVDQIGNLLISKGICTEDDWEEAINKKYDYPFLRYSDDVRNPLEGFLFPDTYRISENTNAQTIIKLMLNNFESIWQANYAKQAEEANRDVYEVITIAAMIEKEAMVGKERPTIAGVIENRLRIGMPLQIDATVLYALGKHKEKVYNIDSLVDSPYNTYKYNGLPPGPIASPGQAAINAALNPEKHDYYYYVAKGDGSHYFSKTHDEHI
ncbi:MAG: endolytic transglycosylase MltG [Syntrophomonadaceae bacterium]|nr:endolytic transglycosylase MltG [Syntrophomonadaceae bacterium]